TSAVGAALARPAADPGQRKGDRRTCSGGRSDRRPARACSAQQLAEADRARRPRTRRRRRGHRALLRRQEPLRSERRRERLPRQRRRLHPSRRPDAQLRQQRREDRQHPLRRLRGPAGDQRPRRLRLLTMRATLVLILIASLSACGTSSLGACPQDGECPSNAACDVSSRVCVLRQGPVITGVTFTPAGFTNGSGTVFLGPGAGAVTVGATITDTDGVAASSVCLRIAGETGGCAHPGTPGASNAWTFSLPRPAAPQDGTHALNFTLEADDTLAAGLTG